MATTVNSYTPTPNTQTPGVAPSQFGLSSLNPEGSQYASAYSQSSTNLIRKAIENQIFDTTNQQYKAFYAFYFGQPMKEKPSDEFEYLEKTFGRVAMEAYSWNYSTGVLTLAGTYAEANDIPVTAGDIVTLPVGNKPAIVTAVSFSGSANSSTITLAPYTGGSFTSGSVVAGDIISLQAAAGADGTNFINHYDRLSTVTRYNYLQKFARAYRFGTIELQKLMNVGNTDYIPQNRINTMEQIKTDLFSTFINGTRGEYAINAATSGSYKGKAMGGLYPTMVAAGAPSASVTASGLQPTFKSLVFQTNVLAKGATRFVLGTDETLDYLSGAFKNPTQYAPNDRIASLQLTQYEIGTSKIVPIVCPMFQDSSIFPTFFNRMLMCIDLNSINPVSMMGVPPIRMYQTKDNSDGTNLNAYSDFVVEAYLSMQFNNPAAGFYINLL